MNFVQGASLIFTFFGIMHGLFSMVFNSLGRKFDARVFLAFSLCFALFTWVAA